MTGVQTCALPISESLTALPLLLDGDMARALGKIHAKPQRPSPPRPAGLVPVAATAGNAAAPAVPDPAPSPTE